jgi:hypothetical protein
MSVMSDRAEHIVRLFHEIIWASMLSPVPPFAGMFLGPLGETFVLGNISHPAAVGEYIRRAALSFGESPRSTISYRRSSVPFRSWLSFSDCCFCWTGGHLIDVTEPCVILLEELDSLPAEMKVLVT